MGLTAQVQAGIELAFNAADDLVGALWLTRQEQSSFDPATGDVTQVEVEFEFRGVVDKSSSSGEFDGSTGTAGAEVEGTTHEAVMKPAETEPKVGDVLRVGDQRLRVLSVDPIAPDGSTVLLWILGLAV